MTHTSNHVCCCCCYCWQWVGGGDLYWNSIAVPVKSSEPCCGMLGGFNILWLGMYLCMCVCARVCVCVEDSFCTLLRASTCANIWCSRPLMYFFQWIFFCSLSLGYFLCEISKQIIWKHIYEAILYSFVSKNVHGCMCSCSKVNSCRKIFTWRSILMSSDYRFHIKSK